LTGYWLLYFRILSLCGTYCQTGSGHVQVEGWDVKSHQCTDPVQSRMIGEHTTTQGVKWILVRQPTLWQCSLPHHKLVKTPQPLVCY